MTRYINSAKGTFSGGSYRKRLSGLSCTCVMHFERLLTRDCVLILHECSGPRSVSDLFQVSQYRLFLNALKKEKEKEKKNYNTVDCSLFR